MFSVHENLICGNSDYFKLAMKSYWEATAKGSVTLKEEDPEIFDIYVQWLYYGTLPVRNDSPGLDGNIEYEQLAKAYVLGEMLQDVNFKDAVLDAILIKSRSRASDGGCWFPVGPVVPCIYDGTTESSAARRLLVDLYTDHGHGDWLIKYGSQDDLPKQFLLDLAIATLDKRPYPAESRSNGAGTCEYHEHPPDPNSCYVNSSVSRRREAEQTAPHDTG